MVTANKLVKTERFVCPNCGSTDIVFDQRGVSWSVGIVGW